MSENTLAFPDIAMLLVLMAEAREISNPELEERYGVTLTGKPRTRLNDLKLVESWKQGRSFVHVLTDKGWARVAEEVRAGIPMPAQTGGKPAAAAVVALSAGLQRYLDRTGRRHADLFSPQDDAPPASLPGSVQDGGDSAPPEASAPVSPATLVARIRAAYAELAQEPGAWVSLTKLRPLLADVPREEVDKALRRMDLMDDVEIVPESNRKTLTEQDRDAAVIIGNQDKYFLAIGA
ncbi:hypothetical protein [Microtetraspora malaysiensis]|uniref:MarR family transcriptional regulator n=1 Tax=Microtetraspora malaysiensis TaxID=161358 RepID=A0ABW6T026_9ACTN